MTVIELITAEIESIDEAYLDELYRLVKDFAESKRNGQQAKRSLMSQLRDIKIQGPEDLAANLDAYITGEQNAGEDIR